jgi:membrane associated rhomboid family serine protease
MQKSTFNLEIILYPILLILVLWVIYWGEFYSPIDLIHFGIMPRTLSGLSGVFFSPLLHSTNDIFHLINNTFPIFILTIALLYYYRKIAFQVFFLSWFLSGILTWMIAKNEGSFHIGISSIIYSLVCFLFVSGVLGKQKQLQAVSLLIVFIYGSLVWGVFPMEEKVSWQGHLGGSITGIALAAYYYEVPTNKKENKKIELPIEDKTQVVLHDIGKQYQNNSSSVIKYTYTKTKLD